MGKLCTEDGFDYHWVNGGTPYLQKGEIKIFLIPRSVNVEHFKVLLLKDKAGKSLSNHEAIEATVKLIN